MERTLEELVWNRAGACCEYCRSQERFSLQSFSAEHIQPRSLGGKTRLPNLAWACQGCNNHKYNKTTGIDPVTGTIVALFHPRRQDWRDHFAWNKDCAIIIGLTSIGRATVATMKLNRRGLVNLRRILFAASEHPP